ncbi:Protein of unknown function [Gryllus bimaculatus]|nr:Protein of unknown function [Gryllus bimaculatus]
MREKPDHICWPDHHEEEWGSTMKGRRLSAEASGEDTGEFWSVDEYRAINWLAGEVEGLELLHLLLIYSEQRTWKNKKVLPIHC